MATFGQGINPVLGRIDYSPYMQGAQQGAQMSGASASKAWGDIGQGIEKGLQEYQLNKKITSDAIGEVEGMVQASPSVMKWLSDPANDTQAAKLFKKLGKTGALGVNDATTLNGAVRSFVKSEQMGIARQQQDTQNRIAQQQADADSNRAEAAMIAAEREKAGVPGRVMTLEQLNAIPKGTDYKAIPQQDGTFFVTSVSPFAPAAVTNLNMGGNAYDKTLGESAANQHMSEYNAAVAAPQAIAKLDEVQSILKSGDVTTGVGAELFQNVNRLRAQFLNDQKAGKTVSNTQILDSLLGSDVFPMISALGIGARGMDTPAEREFLRASFTGTKEMTPEALQRLTEIRRDIQLRAVEKFQKNNEQGTYKKFFEVTGNPVPDFSSIPPKEVPFDVWQSMPEDRRALFRKK